MQRTITRQKTIHCGSDFKEVRLYRYTENQQMGVRKKRNKRQNLSPPKQKNLNDKNSKDYFRWTVECNFTKDDYHITLSYDPAFLPANFEAARRDLKNYIERAQRLAKKKGVPPLKYAAVTTNVTNKAGEISARLHHHLIISGSLSRDDMEDLWCRSKKKIGRTKAEKLQPDENGLAGLCEYLAQQTSPSRVDAQTGEMIRQKRWIMSKGLKRPQVIVNDNRMSLRQMEKLCKNPPDKSYWEKKYPGWTPCGDTYGAAYKYDEQNGWSIVLQLRKKEAVKWKNCKIN